MRFFLIVLILILAGCGTVGEIVSPSGIFGGWNMDQSQPAGPSSVKPIGAGWAAMGVILFFIGAVFLAIGGGLGLPGGKGMAASLMISGIGAALLSIAFSHSWAPVLSLIALIGGAGWVIIEKRRKYNERSAKN